MPTGRIGDVVVIVEHAGESEQRCLLEVLVRVCKGSVYIRCIGFQLPKLKLRSRPAQ
jgi:hypothetical protein